MEIEKGAVDLQLAAALEKLREVMETLRAEQERRRLVEEELEAATAQLNAQQLDVSEASEQNDIATPASAHGAGITQPVSEKWPRKGPNYIALSTSYGKKLHRVRIVGHTLPKSVLPRFECVINKPDALNYGDSFDLAARAFIALIKSRLDELASADGNAEYSRRTVRA